jgi:hypothetical protein
VATFVGSPAMNLYEAGLEPAGPAGSAGFAGSAGAPVVVIGSQRLALPTQAAAGLAAYQDARSSSASGPKTWRHRLIRGFRAATGR